MLAVNYQVNVNSQVLMNQVNASSQVSMIQVALRVGDVTLLRDEFVHAIPCNLVQCCVFCSLVHIYSCADPF